MVIDQQRNQRFWQACGWKEAICQSLNTVVWDTPDGAYQHELPDPSDLSFVGYLLRDGPPKVREKLSHPNTEIAIRHERGQELCIIRFVDSLGYGGSYVYEAPTLLEAMFNAFEQAMGLDKEER